MIYRLRKRRQITVLNTDIIDFNADAFIEGQIKDVQEQTRGGKVLLALSGGVDSSVVAALLIKAIGDRLVCIHVDHGLMRKDESAQIIATFSKQLGANIVYVTAAQRFLKKLTGVSDPEVKRKIIGEEFISVFKEEARKLDSIKFLAQGTIYPDIIESEKGVKAHHNVGGLPKELGFELVEPLRSLYKEQVRSCGLALGLPRDMVYRQPFPGPGLGVRCLGAITQERLTVARESDFILREEFGVTGAWQYFTVVPDIKSVGLRDGKRTFEHIVIIRAVNSVDAMTAEPISPDWALLQKAAGRILSEVPGVNRVCYDLTSKPPGTIEWE